MKQLLRLSKYRQLIDKKPLKKNKKKIPSIEVINNDTKQLESIYKQLLLTKNNEDLVKIIKTTYLKNEERINNME